MDPDFYLENLDSFLASPRMDFSDMSPASESNLGQSEGEVMSLADSQSCSDSPHTSQLFTPEEDELLRHMASELNFDWPRIARLFQNKTPSQVAKRWSNKLDPSIKKTKWSADEDRSIELLQRLHGNNWKLIAQHLPGRPATAIKSRYYNAIKRKGENHSVLGKAYLAGGDGRSIRQMEIPMKHDAATVMQTLPHDKEIRITALRKQLAGMEVLMANTKAEISRLKEKMQTQDNPQI